MPERDVAFSVATGVLAPVVSSNLGSGFEPSEASSLNGASTANLRAACEHNRPRLSSLAG